jgi:hypothetical protein
MPKKRVGEHFQPGDQLQYLRSKRIPVLCAKAGDPKFKKSPKILSIPQLCPSLHDAAIDSK